MLTQFEIESALIRSRNEVKEAKDAYSAAIARRSASQREVNELLQRKQEWSPNDLERFTNLYRSDHVNEQEELQAGERLSRAEHAADEAQAELGRSILTRYHEEQIWSDKIRRASTYGTWALMAFNVVLFMVVQLGLEPWKRKRLVGSFEEKVNDLLGERSLVVLNPDAIKDQNGSAKKYHGVEDVLDMPEGLVSDSGDKAFISSASHKSLSIHSAKEALSLLRGIFFGSANDGTRISQDAIYESTRSELAIWSGASALLGAATVGLVSIIVRLASS